MYWLRIIWAGALLLLGCVMLYAALIQILQSPYAWIGGIIAIMGASRLEKALE